MDLNLRNLKDFLILYNKVTEMCFSRCVDSLNGRAVARHEDVCVDRCVTKFARFNQHMMAFYVAAQTTMNAKRMKEMEEMEEEARLAEQQQQQQQQKKERQREEQRLNELGPTSVLTPVPPTSAGNLSI